MLHITQNRRFPKKVLKSKQIKIESQSGRVDNKMNNTFDAAPYSH